MAKVKKIVFSEKVDSAINGYSLGMSFLLISVFFYVRNDYFYFPILSYWACVLLGAVGCVGCGIELSRSIKVQGAGEIALGTCLLLIWWIVYQMFLNPFVNFLILFFLMFGIYGVIRGVLSVLYSLGTCRKQSDTSKTTTAKNIFLVFTQICGLILTILNILKIIGVVSGSNL